MQHVADQALQLVGLLVTFPHISLPSGAGYMAHVNGNRLGSGSSYTGGGGPIKSRDPGPATISTTVAGVGMGFADNKFRTGTGKVPR